MRSSSQRTRDVIMYVYRSQLKKFKELSEYDVYSRFILCRTTEFGVKVTENLIKITEKRLMELANQSLKRRGVRPLENYTNGKAK